MDPVPLMTVKMLKKKLGIEAIEKNWDFIRAIHVHTYFKVSSTLIIPEACKKIGEYSFYNCERLKEVIIPGKVERIGDCAFEWCDNLKEVVIPESVKKIGGEAFRGCKNATIILKKPNFAFEKGYRAFWGCEDVEEETGD